MRSCLNQDELNQLLIHKLYNKPVSYELAYRCELADTWCLQLGALTYLLARVLETMNNEMNDESLAYIDLFYNLPNIMYLEIQEMDYKFVSLLMKTLRLPDLTLEDELIQMHVDMMDHDFNRALRY